MNKYLKKSILNFFHFVEGVPADDAVKQAGTDRSDQDGQQDINGIGAALDRGERFLRHGHGAGEGLGGLRQRFGARLHRGVHGRESHRPVLVGSLSRYFGCVSMAIPMAVLPQ